LVEAADVLEFAPDLIDGVKRGDSLKHAAEIARKRKADAETRDTKLARLAEHAADLKASSTRAAWPSTKRSTSLPTARSAPPPKRPRSNASG
jgi:hypothetical protein